MRIDVGSQDEGATGSVGRLGVMAAAAGITARILSGQQQPGSELESDGEDGAVPAKRAGAAERREWVGRRARGGVWSLEESVR